jgi:hypothetical protein
LNQEAIRTDGCRSTCDGSIDDENEHGRPRQMLSYLPSDNMKPQAGRLYLSVIAARDDLRNAGWRGCT